MSTTLEIKFKVQDDKGTENGGEDTDTEWRTLSAYAIPPASMMRKSSTEFKLPKPCETSKADYKPQARKKPSNTKQLALCPQRNERNSSQIMTLACTTLTPSRPSALSSQI